LPLAKVLPSGAELTWRIVDGPGVIDDNGVYHAPTDILEDTTVTFEASYVEGGEAKTARYTSKLLNSLRKWVAIRIAAFNPDGSERDPIIVKEGETIQLYIVKIFDDGSEAVVEPTQ